MAKSSSQRQLPTPIVTSPGGNETKLSSILPLKQPLTTKGKSQKLKLKAKVDLNPVTKYIRGDVEKEQRQQDFLVKLKSNLGVNVVKKMHQHEQQ